VTSSFGLESFCWVLILLDRMSDPIKWGQIRSSGVCWLVSSLLSSRSITSTYHSPVLLRVPVLSLSCTQPCCHHHTSRMSDDVCVYTSGSPLQYLTTSTSNYAPTLLRHRPLVSPPSTAAALDIGPMPLSHHVLQYRCVLLGLLQIWRVVALIFFITLITI
jgi:hypothetical protein